MAKSRVHLSRAPLVEALLDFRVEPREDVQVADLAPLCEELKSEYSQQGKITQGELAVELDAEGMPTSSTRGAVTGQILRSDDGKVAQFRVDGFTFSKLRPYSAWDELAPEALTLWARYVEIARPIGLRRLAVRYINRLDFPLANLEDWLTTPPSSAPGSRRLLREFLSRVVVWDQEAAATAIITQAMPPMMTGRLSVVLDIDVFREGDLPLDLEINRENLDQLRNLKNQIFFESLTERAVALYV